MSASDSSAKVDVQERDISNLVGTQHDSLKYAGPDGKALPHTAAMREDQVETHVAPAAGAPMPTADEFMPKGSGAELKASASASASASSTSSTTQLDVDRESSNVARDIQASKPDQSKQRSDMSIDLSKRDAKADASASADAEDKDKDKAGEKQSWTAAIGGAISSLLGTFSPRGHNNNNADDVKQTDAAPTKQPAAASASDADKADRKEKRKSWTSIDDKNHPDYKTASSIPQQPEHLPNAPWADPKQFEREVKEHRHDDLKGIKELSPREQKADAEDPAERWLEKNKPEDASSAAAAAAEGSKKDKRKSWTSIDDKNHPDHKLAASIPKQPEPLPNAPWADPKQFEREVKEHRHDDLKGIKELSPREQKATAEDPAERWLEKNKPEDASSAAAAADKADRKDKRKSWTSIDDKNHPDYKSAASVPQQPEPLPNAPWADPKEFEREVKEHRHDVVKGIKELSPREQKADAADPAERWLEKNKPEGDSDADRKDKRKSWTSIDDKNHPDHKLAASIPQQPEPLPNAPWADPKQFEREVKEHRHDDLKGIANLQPVQQHASKPDPSDKWLDKNSCATDAKEGSCDKAAASASAPASAACDKPKAANELKPSTASNNTAWTGSSNPILAASPSKQQQGAVDPSDAWLRQEGGFSKTKPAAEPKQGKIDFKELEREQGKDADGKDDTKFADKWATAKTDSSIDQSALKTAQTDKRAGEVTRTPPMGQRGEASMAK